MGKLRDAGLVEVTKVGIWAYYRLSNHLEPRTRALLDVLV
jgi:DNA-binding transcriptional ArsR family regulator